MTNKEPGYVYILTNPSFREDWVKIGKSIEMPLVPTKGTSISHIPHFVTSHDFRGDALRQEKLHQFGAELQSIENKNPIKLHQLGAEIASPTRVSAILDNGDMLPLFGIVPWKHHVLIVSKCGSVEEAFYYLQRTLDEGLSRSELEDLLLEVEMTMMISLS